MTTAADLTAAQPVVTTLAGIVRDLLGQEDEQQVLHQLAQDMLGLFGADDVGILLGDQRSSLRVVAATSSEATVLDLLQLEQDDGPCLDAYRTGEENLLTDMEGDPRWPAWEKAARELGYGSAASAPLLSLGRSLGTIIVLARPPRELGAAHLAMLEVLADVTTLAVVTSRARADDRRLTDQLQSALDSRVVIEQAKGIVAERDKITLEEAFERLRAQARRERSKMAAVARAVLDGHAGAEGGRTSRKG